LEVDLILASICAAAAILIALSKGSNLVELLFVFSHCGFLGVCVVCGICRRREGVKSFSSHIMVE
jgi:cytidine deaminase